MVHPTSTNGGVVELTRMRLHLVNEVVERVGWKIRSGHQHQVSDGQFTNGCKVFGRVIRNFGIQALVQAEGAVRGNQKGVAIASTFGDKVSPDDFIGPGFVVHDHGLRQGVPQLLSDGSDHHICWPPSRKGNHDFDGLVGVGLGPAHG